MEGMETGVLLRDLVKNGGPARGTNRLWKGTTRWCKNLADTPYRFSYGDLA